MYRGEDCCSDEELQKVMSLGIDLKSDSVKINLRTVCAALKRLGIAEPFSNPAICRALADAASISGLRGRWERIMDAPEVVCDIGHNAEALGISMKQLERESAGKRLVMVYGMAGDKDIEAVKDLLPSNAEYVFTNAVGSRAMPAGKLRTILGKNGLEEDTVEKAVKMALEIAGREGFVYIGGSCFVVAEAINFFDKLE